MPEDVYRERVFISHSLKAMTFKIQAVVVLVTRWGLLCASKCVAQENVPLRRQKGKVPSGFSHMWVFPNPIHAGGCSWFGYFLKSSDLQTIISLRTLGFPKTHQTIVWAIKQNNVYTSFGRTPKVTSLFRWEEFSLLCVVVSNIYHLRTASFVFICLTLFRLCLWSLNLQTCLLSRPIWTLWHPSLATS